MSFRQSQVSRKLFHFTAIFNIKSINLILNCICNAWSGSRVSKSKYKFNENGRKRLNSNDATALWRWYFMPLECAFLRSNAFKFLTIHSFLDFVVFHIFRCGLIYVHASIHRNIDEKFSQVFYTSYNNSWESFLPNTFSMLDDCQPMGSIDFILESQTCCHFPDNSPLSDNINRCNELVHDFVND